jgi:hypothetical protein
MRRLENYVRKYGPEFGPILYHVLQSQAAHAGVSARLRRKIEILSAKEPTAPRRAAVEEPLPLYPDAAAKTAVPVDVEPPLAIGA